MTLTVCRGEKIKSHSSFNFHLCSVLDSNARQGALAKEQSFPSSILHRDTKAELIFLMPPHDRPWSFCLQEVTWGQREPPGVKGSVGAVPGPGAVFSL